MRPHFGSICGRTREMRIITVIFSIFLFFADLIALGLVIAIFPGVVEKYQRKCFYVNFLKMRLILI